MYLADALVSKETLEKSHLIFVADVEKYLDTLNRLLDMSAFLFVPSHAEPLTDIRELVKLNIENTFEMAEWIQMIRKKGKYLEEVVRELADIYKIPLFYEKYILLESTVKAYLRWLEG